MKTKTYKIQVKQEDELVEIDVDRTTIEFYKKETGHNRVTKSGLSRFLNNLIILFGH